MSIRKVRANSAQVEGDYVHIEQHSLQPFGAIVGLLSGFFLAILVANDWLTGGILVLLAVFIGIALSPGKVVREIPQADLVEIKHYPNESRVTVVIDDERVKHKQK